MTKKSRVIAKNDTCIYFRYLTKVCEIFGIIIKTKYKNNGEGCIFCYYLSFSNEINRLLITFQNSPLKLRY